MPSADSARISHARSEERAGLAFALAEVIVVGLVPAINKFASERIDPLLYGATAATVAGVVALALAAGRGELNQIFQRRAILWLVPIALLGTTATTLLMLFGARLTDSVQVALLLQVEPIYSLILAAVLWGRRPPPRQVFGTALILAGVVMVLYDGRLALGIGAVLILLVPLGFQLSHVMALRVMPPMSPYALTAARYFYGGGGLIVAQMALGTAPISSLGASGFAMASFHGVVLFLCGTLFWYETIRRIDIARATAIVTPCEPVISVILVWWILGSIPTGWQFAGIALLLPGMLILLAPSKNRTPA